MNLRFAFFDSHYGESIGHYELNSFPGCSQIVVSNHAFINKEWRGKGFGDSAHKERLDKARELGLDYIMCTCKDSNFVQVKILEKNGWKKLDSFLNRETNHFISIWGKYL